jgi:hypothetical protein
MDNPVVTNFLKSQWLIPKVYFTLCSVSIGGLLKDCTHHGHPRAHTVCISVSASIVIASKARQCIPQSWRYLLSSSNRSSVSLDSIEKDSTYSTQGKEKRFKDLLAYGIIGGTKETDFRLQKSLSKPHPEPGHPRSHAYSLIRNPLIIGTLFSIRNPFPLSVPEHACYSLCLLNGCRGPLKAHKASAWNLCWWRRKTGSSTHSRCSQNASPLSKSHVSVSS